MLEIAQIDARLREMSKQPSPQLRWDEQCDGSARALVVFVGPSPGRKKRESKNREPRKTDCIPALWNESYTDPLTWKGGFRTGFSPLVEALFAADYETSSKLIGRANLDWRGNPKAKDVPEEFMVEGAPSVMRMIAACAPELVLPMGKKAFRVLQKVMDDDGFRIEECEVNEFTVRISDAAKKRFHRRIHAFRAASPKGPSLIVIKLPQHPSKMYAASYGKRCGQAVRTAARQIADRQAVDVAADLADARPKPPATRLIRRR